MWVTTLILWDTLLWPSITTLPAMLIPPSLPITILGGLLDIPGVLIELYLEDIKTGYDISHRVSI
jgi:hypothetical protein